MKIQSLPQSLGTGTIKPEKIEQKSEARHLKESQKQWQINGDKGGLIMREILFKAKRIDNEEWVEGNILFGPNNMTYILPIGGTLWDAVQVNRSTVC